MTAGVMEGKFMLIQYEDGRQIGDAYEVTGRGPAGSSAGVTMTVRHPAS
jgi:hypothetical protein